MGELILWIWLIGWAISILPIARTLINAMDRDTPSLGVDKTDIAFGAFIGVLLGAVWPVLIPVYFVYTKLAAEYAARKEERESKS